MLRLKDNVELSELAKYGFYEDIDGWYYWSGKMPRLGTRKMGILKKSRVLKFNGISIPILDILFDMINDEIFIKISNEDYRYAKNKLIEKIAELEARIKELEG